MLKEKLRYKNYSEDGVALIFALSLLALLLILLIGFLASSILEQRIAYTYGDATASRLLARGSIVRIKDQLESSGDDVVWIRNRPVDGRLLAPVVSIANKGDLYQATDDEAQDNGEGGDAYQALKPLLRRYFGGSNRKVTAHDIKKSWHWPNFFPAGTKVDYPQWIYYYNTPDDEVEEVITGRMAYVIIPNFGLDPARTAKVDSTDPQIGVNYNELSMVDILADNGIDTFHKYGSNWLSLDWVLGKNGITNNNYLYNLSTVADDFYNGELSGYDEKAPDSNEDKLDEDYREFASLYFTTNQSLIEEQDYTGSSRTFFDLKNVKDVSTYISMLENLKFQPASARSQVAANLRDYLDTDSVPTSDSTNWTTTAPTYTGNEKTPYINQIIPAVQVSAEYNLTSTPIRIFGVTISTIYTQTVTLNCSGRIYIELINIYPEDLNAGSVVIRGLEMDLEYDSSAGSFLLGNDVSISSTNPITVSYNGLMSKNGYAAISVPINNSSLLPSRTLTNVTTVSGNAPAPELTIGVNITGIKFDSAILNNQSNVNIDYVTGLSIPGVRPLVGVYELTDPVTGTTTMFDSGISWVFGDIDAQRTAAGYASFEVYDPRCNLDADEWHLNFKSTTASLNASAVPNYQARNPQANPQNDDPTKEMDLEPNDDPAFLVNAYIRNGAMESPWELGFIHRGTRWQTLNLKSALSDPLQDSNSDFRNGEAYKMTYFNDGILWDRLKFSNASHAAKFNINYLASKSSIFAMLIANLYYHKPTPVINSIELEEADAVPLDSAARKELISWIANKCYDASGSDPANASSQVYNRYIHRGQLANVITDWALNGSDSPFKGSAPVDAHIEELIGKIAPLTYCGESFEYFTAFVVAQSIKDAQGKVYIFKNDNTIDEDNTPTSPLEHGGTVESKATDGVTDVYYDKITSTTYLVARLRRKIVSCKKTDSCLQGVHHRDCRFKVEVIESYTLSDL